MNIEGAKMTMKIKTEPEENVPDSEPDIPVKNEYEIPYGNSPLDLNGIAIKTEVPESEGNSPRASERENKNILTDITYNVKIEYDPPCEENLSDNVGVNVKSEASSIGDDPQPEDGHPNEDVPMAPVDIKAESDVKWRNYETDTNPGHCGTGECSYAACDDGAYVKEPPDEFGGHGFAQDGEYLSRNYGQMIRNANNCRKNRNNPIKVIMFNCYYCEFKSKSFLSVKEHSLGHKGEAYLRCDICNYKALHVAQLRKHKMSHTGERPVRVNGAKTAGGSRIRKKQLQCDSCSFESMRASTMRKHKLKHGGETLLKCDKCEYTTLWRNSFKAHVAIHTGEMPYKCDQCEYKTVFSYELSKHLTAHRAAKTSEEEEKPFVCDECDLAFALPEELDGHKSTHVDRRIFTCDLCPLKFAHSSSLVRHKSTHAAETPYNCEACGMRFGRASQLKSHRVVHSDGKIYACDRCPYKSVRLQGLKEHQMNHTGEKPHRCDQCDYSSVRISSLRSHQKTHKGEQRLKSKETPE